MRTWTLLVSLCALLMIPPRGAGAQDKQDEDTCILFCSTCLAGGGGNFYLYHLISSQELPIKEGDKFRYEVFILSSSPELKGGVDIQFSDGTNLRDMGLSDQNGIRSHGEIILEDAKGKWYARTIDLTPAAGRTANGWDLVGEGNATGAYIQFIDNICVEHQDGTKTWIYENGRPPKDEIHWKEGYSKEARLAIIPRRDVVEGLKLPAVIERELNRSRLRALAVRQDAQMGTLAEILKREGREDLLKKVDEARAKAPDPETFEGTPEAYLAALREAAAGLSDAQPVIQKYAGHLVGHAHIDFQWLWEWPETVDVCRTTFAQAIKFMEQYPGFKFTQSSAALYLLMEEEDPDLFRKIQQFVKKGQWELAGGRWSEGDTNIMSAESHARQFLYGQRYFREKFGVAARAGWEPDTFGHTWQMPQMLRLAGIDNYYFCRGGKKEPLINWEAPDGSRVLAFEEPALGLGGWSNSDVTGAEFKELLAFNEKYGAKDMLWVYGVGNHGGGPTRENIETAIDWQKSATLPTVKFSTAAEFFDALKAQPLHDVKTVRHDLNTVFEGCYTTHGDVKRWNRDSESLLVAAETAAAIASRYGFVYPRRELLADWRDVMANQHHDTIDGSAFHPAYRLSRRQYERVLASTRGILRHATETIADNVVCDAGSLMVFNTLGWRRDAVVTAAPTPAVPAGDLEAVPPSGEAVPVQRTAEGDLVFVARDLPAYGYRVYTIRPAAARAEPVGVDRDGALLSTPRLDVEIDAKTGAVTRLYDKQLKREIISKPANDLVIHVEVPPHYDGPAWGIGRIDRVLRPADAGKIELVENGPVRARIRVRRGFDKSSWSQDIFVYRDLDLVEFQLDVDWQQRGSADKGAPFLRVQFPIAAEKPVFRTSIPFGDIERPVDGKEVPALQWVDLGTPDFGVALMNDSKHGHSASDGTIQLSLLRSSYEPDPIADLGRHFIRYALLPHAGSIHDAGVSRRGFEFNNAPSVCWTGRYPGSWTLGKTFKATLPKEGSFLSLDGTSVIPTALKLAEDGREWVVRFYESSGADGRTAVTCAWPVEKAEVVNLIEDPLGDADPANVPVRGYEIKTLRLMLGTK